MGKALQAIRVAERTNTDIHGSSTLENEEENKNQTFK